MSEKTRKAVTTLAEVKSAWNDLCDILVQYGFPINREGFVQSLSGGFVILGSVPEGLPTEFPNKETAKNFLQVYAGAFNVAKGLLTVEAPEDAARELTTPDENSSPDDEMKDVSDDIPEVMTPSEIKDADVPPKSRGRRRVAATA